MLLYIKRHVVHFFLFFVYSAWEHWLSRTKRIIANSTWELLALAFARLFNKKGKDIMSFSKVIELGSAGSLTVSEAAGVATVKVSVGGSLGGGLAAGVAKAQASAEVDIEAAQLAQLALDLLKSKLPASAQSLITALEEVAIPALKSL